jgi:hypothetical protein
MEGREVRVCECERERMEREGMRRERKERE